MKIVTLFLFFLLISCEGRSQYTGEVVAKEELKAALGDSGLHNVVHPDSLLIKDKTAAIRVAEAILFPIYGEKAILRQKPYAAYLVDQYWVITGTLHEQKGGTFLIILDARNSRVIRISHGK